MKKSLLILAIFSLFIGVNAFAETAPTPKAVVKTEVSAEKNTFKENVQETTKRVNSLRNKIKDLGSINIDSIEEYNQTKQRYDFMCEQRLDLEDGMAKLKKVIQDMTNIMKEQFKEKEAAQDKLNVVA